MNQARKNGRRYGLSQMEVENMNSSQAGRCGICAEDQSATMHIDHCHATGKVRGLLCRKCNFLLGLAGDRIKILERAIAYLKSAETTGFRPTSRRCIELLRQKTADSKAMLLADALEAEEAKKIPHA